MTVTYDATHHETLQVSPITRLICHLCRELTHPFAHSVMSRGMRYPWVAPSVTDSPTSGPGCLIEPVVAARVVN